MTMSRIHEVATITSKGQITLPKPIRQALGVDSGGKVAFDFNGKAITVTRAEPGEHNDPAIARFLALIERDIAEGRNVAALPANLARSLKQAKQRRVDLSADIEGDVTL
jgi:antitoxin PrlF